MHPCHPKLQDLWERGDKILCEVRQQATGSLHVSLLCNRSTWKINADLIYKMMAIPAFIQGFDYFFKFIF